MGGGDHRRKNIVLIIPDSLTVQRLFLLDSGDQGTGRPGVNALRRVTQRRLKKVLLFLYLGPYSVVAYEAFVFHRLEGARVAACCAVPGAGGIP